MTSGAWQKRAALEKKRPLHAAGNLIAFPVFEDHRHSIVEWADKLEEGRGAAIVPAMREAHARLCRVTTSKRHVRLAEFVYHAILAIESGETIGARYILLTSLAALGWPLEHIGRT